MFGIGSTEFLVILLVALVVLGPKSLASVSRTLGKAMGEFRRVSTDFQRTLNAEVEQEEHLKRKQEAEKEFFSPEARAEHAAKTAPQTQAAAQPAAPQAQTAPAPAAAPAATETAARPAVQPEAIPSGVPVPPTDSPLAQALAKAQAEAGGAATTAPADATPASGAKA
ncbi:twin-arginine translocase TatA/TatE family subunit [uncultured Desulfovibrio sp.]|mgnify:CR=1 FL=1|uniref:twin-arginine translocase TatA/TatE family subunit n=2 Tax=Desulfovibrio TaxID=872 RepID=UPI00265CADE1|nr:twin-arginine translocase TatA/TatE family subunit [uncultured Desulfovibrio sp.]